MAEREQLCATCRFWERPRGREAGLCRRYAPRFTGPAPAGEVEVCGYPRWPLTLDSEWCGEWGPAAAANG